MTTRRSTKHTLALVVAAALALSACGGSPAATEPARAYTIRLRTTDDEDRYRYVAEDPLDVRVGDEVTFDVSIDGTLPHDLQVVDPSGAAMATAPPAAPGSTTSVTVLFTEPGFYRLNCLVGDHLTEHQMQAIIEVAEP